MADMDLPRVARTTTLTLLTDWPLSKPNRDLSGDQKAATIGGVRRHVMSSANRKAVWRRVMVPGSLLWLAKSDADFAGTYSMSTRTKYVAERVVAPTLLADREVREHLTAMGFVDDAQCQLIAEHVGEALFRVMQKAEERPSVIRESGERPGIAESDGGEQATNSKEKPGETLMPGGLLKPDSREKAIAAYGPHEIELICDAVRDTILKSRDPKKLAKGELTKALESLLSRDDATKALWNLSRAKRLGIDGALFGTMVTQHDYRVAAPSAVQVSHSITVHRAFDFETLEIAKDDLEDGPQAAIMLDASYASGLYATAVTIDHCQLLENVMAPEIRDGNGKWVERIRWKRWGEAQDGHRDLAAKLARALAISILYASDHAMKTQTNARVYPSYVLAETSAKGGINLLGAFSEPVNERRTNSILSKAIQALRAYSTSFDAGYGMAERRAEFTPSPLAQPDAPDGWSAEEVTTAKALADWVEQRVLETRLT
jgi:hypothetical protein